MTWKLFNLPSGEQMLVKKSNADNQFKMEMFVIKFETQKSGSLTLLETKRSIYRILKDESSLDLAFDGFDQDQAEFLLETNLFEEQR